MTSLPPLILRMPRIFYFAAALVFVASFGLTLAEVNSTLGYAEAGNPIARLTVLRGFYQSALEAVYIVANGVLVQVLLAIWARGGAHGSRGGDE